MIYCLICRMFSKNQTKQHVGDILMGFAVLMFGMSTMSAAVSPLRDEPVFLRILTSFSNPLLGILVGIAFTSILQSASAAVGILQALSITGAITFEEREAPAYDEAAVQENKKKKELQEKMKHLHEGGCPGSRMRMLEQPETAAESAVAAPVQPVSRLRNWPVQIKLAPVHAPYFEGAKLLIAADCTAYAYANFHQEFMRGKVTLIGCPKLDAVDYSEKLTEILRSNDIQSVTILRMEVPCCGGLEMAAKKALQTSGKFIPWQVVTISIDGKILD